MQRPIVYFDTATYRTGFHPEILHRSIGAAVDVRRGTLQDAIGAQAAEDYPILFHLLRHDSIIRPTPENQDLRGAVQRTLDVSSDFVDAGGKIVWSTNPIAFEDPAVLRLQNEFNAHMAEVSEVIHLTSWRALEALSQHTSVPFEKTVVISPGSPTGQFATWPGPAARQKLDIDEDIFVFLTFDTTTQTNDLSKEFETFEELKEDGVLLLVVPSVHGADEIRSTSGNVRLANCLNSKEELGIYLAAADAIIVPQSAVTGAEEALTYAAASLGVIAPDQPELSDIYADQKNALLYPSQDQSGLIRSLRVALSEGREIWSERGASAGHVARCRDWGIAARQWIAIYRSLSELPRPGTIAPGAWVEVVAE